MTGKLAALIERTALAIGRLGARISARPERVCWMNRAAWAGFSAASP